MRGGVRTCTTCWNLPGLKGMTMAAGKDQERKRALEEDLRKLQAHTRSYAEAVPQIRKGLNQARQELEAFASENPYPSLKDVEEELRTRARQTYRTLQVKNPLGRWVSVKTTCSERALVRWFLRKAPEVHRRLTARFEMRLRAHARKIYNCCRSPLVKGSPIRVGKGFSEKEIFAALKQKYLKGGNVWTALAQWTGEVCKGLDRLQEALEATTRALDFVAAHKPKNAEEKLLAPYEKMRAAMYWIKKPIQALPPGMRQLAEWPFAAFDGLRAPLRLLAKRAARTEKELNKTRPRFDIIARYRERTNAFIRHEKLPKDYGDHD